LNDAPAQIGTDTRAPGAPGAGGEV